jgi:uncharacterized lipoprotein YddW (UPF0748 family)
MKLSLKFMPLLLAIILFLNTVCKERQTTTKEARGLWVSRMEWAVQSDTDRVETQKQKIIEILDDAKQAWLNFVLFQIRGSGDAFYRSQNEPWSDMLTGILGKDPGWDPLEFAIEQAHARGLELHAWFNTFTAWRGTEPPPHADPEQLYNAHPEWIVCDKNGKRMPLSSHYVFLSPGIPEARDYVHQVAMDIVKNYDIDGFHFDYIRYPEGSNNLGYSQDPVSMGLFDSPIGNPSQLNWEDWQRENINQFVRKFYDEATALKPWLKISAAVIGKYDYSDWNGYHVVFQDAHQWIAEGKMDFIVPMVYWQTDHPTAPYEQTVRNWFETIHERYIFPGMMVNNLGAVNWPLTELVNQIEINRHGTNGMVFFSYRGLKKAISQLKTCSFDYLANLPSMSWKDDKPPMDPRNLRVHTLSSGNVLLIWSLPDSVIETGDVHRYNIFRSEKSPVNFLNADNLVHITAQNDTFYVDKSIVGGHRYYYVITALDRVNNESPPSNQVAVTIPQYVLSDRMKAINSE